LGLDPHLVRLRWMDLAAIIIFQQNFTGSL